MRDERAHHQPWEKVFERVATPFEEFIHEETTSGLILMVCTIIAMFLANSFLHQAYEHVLHTELAISLGGLELRHTLHHWINDGLMALFFFVVGLEIKREVIVGEISDPRAALMPIIAAVGGMVFPALFYSMFNLTGDGVNGWGVPMATDIAFAVGVLALLGSRVPRTVLTFLVALAIVDDLGAVVVIALFYTDQLYINWLIVAAVLMLLLVSFNRFGIRKPLPYFIIGLVIWFAMLQSGVHATLAGVLVALTIPVKPRYDTSVFVEHMNDLLQELKNIREDYADRKFCIIRDSRARAILQTLENGVHTVESPLQRLEHSMHMLVAFLIIPLFALANAGIPVEISSLGQTLGNPITLGVIAGLVVGKLVGIAGMVWLAMKMGIGRLPDGMNVQHLIGVGLLGGIGFTMSIFIAELGFAGQEDALLMAKTGVLFASLIAGTAGFLWMRIFTSPDSDNEQTGHR
jgi:NhaA family Na+:H+ antiporter